MRPFVSSALLFSLTGLGSAYAGAPATPGLQVTKPIYEWKTETDFDKKTKQLNHCLVKNMYDNGTLLMLAQNNEGVQRIALQFPQNKMTVGTHYDLTMQVDKRDLFPVEAVAVSPQILTVGIPDALPDQMRKGQALSVRGPNDEVVYMLDGADGAVLALRDCISTNKYQKHSIDVAQDDSALKDALPTKPVETKQAEIKPVETKPAQSAEIKAATPVKAEPAKPAEPKTAPIVASPEVKPAPAAPIPAPAVNAPGLTDQLKQLANKMPSLQEEKKIEVAETLLPERLNAVIDMAGLAPQKLLTTPDRTTDKSLDYAWLKNNVFLGIKEQKPVPQPSLPETATSYLKLLKQRCGGSFIAEAALPQTIKNKAMNWLVVETACSSGKKDDTIAALLFANDAQHLTIYFAEAPVKQGSDAIKARDKILNVLQK